MEKLFRKLIGFREALELIDQNIHPISRIQELELDEALGRICAADMRSEMDLPPFPRAAMDGYALRASDTYGASSWNPVRLKCIGEIYAGEESSLKIQPGECIKIATGGMVPPGADAVVMLEHTQFNQGWVEIFKPVHPRENISHPGSDISSGDVIASSGQILDPIRIAALAAAGYSKVKVYAKPRVGIISTGNEIAPPGSELRPAQVYDCNSYLISGLVAQHGGIPIRYGIFPDEYEKLKSILELSSNQDDLILVTGGSSVGVRDLMLDLIQELGEIIFHGVRIKPGKPTIFGKIKEKPILGLPGYPASCFISALNFLVPAVCKLSRYPMKISRIQAELSQRIYAEPGMRKFITVKLRNGRAHPCFKEAGAITSVLNADGILEIQEDEALIESGDKVEIKLLR